MNRKITRAAIGTSLVALAVTGTASASTTHSGTESLTRRTAMHLVAHDDPSNFGFDDLGAPSKRGPGLGDMLAFSQPLTRHGRHTGRINAVSVGVDQKRHLFQNMGTVRLAHGDIEYGGLVSQKSHFILAVTGGTGRYKGASGTVGFVFKGHQQLVTITLRR